LSGFILLAIREAQLPNTIEPPSDYIDAGVFSIGETIEPLSQFQESFQCQSTSGYFFVTLKHLLLSCKTFSRVFFSLIAQKVSFVPLSRVLNLY